MSPRELAREFEAADLRTQDLHDRDVTQAWMAVAIYGMAMSKGRMPELTNLLSGGKDKYRQSQGQMLAQLQTLSKVTGFPLRSVTPAVH